jgi:integrase
MRKRRGRGEGSVFQRKDGAWCGVVTIGYDATGKRRRRYIYGATKAETLERLTRLQHAKFTGELGEPTRFTVAAYLRHWLETAARPAIRESTYTSYATLIRVHIIPCIGGVALSKLAPVHLEHWLADMEKARASARRQQMAYRVLSQALRRAVRLSLVPRNVCHAVTCPRPPKKTVESLTPEQAHKLLQAVRGDRLEALYVLATTTGMREGELFGLQPDDLDLKNGRLFVRQQLSEVGSRLWLAPPKTAKARREIRLPELAMHALHEHRKRMLAEGHWGTDGLVFCDTAGGPLRKSNFLRREWHRQLERAGLFRVEPFIDPRTGQTIIDPDTGVSKTKKVFAPFHVTRHTAATLLLKQGVHPRVVQEILGHSSIAVTMDNYSHVLPSMGAEAAAKMDALFAGAQAKA